MSTLRSAIDELRLVEPDDFSADGLGDELIEVSRHIASLEAYRLEMLAAFEARGIHELDGYLSVTSWLKDRCRMSGGQAAEQVRVGRALQKMPVTRAAFADGDIDFSVVRKLADASRAHPDEFAAHEPALVEAARSLGARPLRTALDYWRQALDEAAALDDANHAYRSRRLHVSATFRGMVRLDGNLDPEGGEIVLSALGSITDNDARNGGNDERSPAQRRADGLVEICRRWLDRGDTTTIAGERPHLAVIVDLEVLERRAPGIAETAQGQVLHPETARRLACDAAVSRIITRGASEPLDVGRRTRTVPPAIRRAVVVRDRRCTFPGCDRPQQWCDAHHIVHWANGGDTSLDNLTLLCRRHHRLIHEGGWTVQTGPDGCRFTRIDGSTVHARRPDP